MKLYIITILVAMVSLLAWTYSNLEYKGYARVHGCTGECYQKYVAEFGTPAEIEMRKQAVNATDEFSSIRGLWAGCAACHGQQGEGIATFPKLAGQTKDYITDRLTTYKNRGQVGTMSSTMWAQAGMLTEQEIQLIGEFIEKEL
tara:strand:- start:2420 stop:2851 length:432 start_codon:yes stop_codon:yes gene_type:complete